MTIADSSDEEPTTVPDESETAGIRRQGQGMRPVNLGGNLGNWEKHTKGIGAKLLLQVYLSFFVQCSLHLPTVIL